MGLLGLPFAEADGGLGGGPVDTLIVMQALGRALALEPYLACVVLAGGLLREAGSAAQRAALVPAIAGGELTLAFAHSRNAGPPRPGRCRHARASAGQRLGHQRREALRACRRQRRHAGGVGPHTRRVARSRGSIAVPRRCRRPRSLAPRLPHAGSQSRGRHPPRPGARRPRGPARNGRDRAASDRACRRRRDRRAVRRERGGDGAAARDDRRVPQGAQAVRRRDRLLPGAAAPRGRHAGGDRTGAQHGSLRRP